MVDILMAVYNGEKFVAEQIDSILAQSETDWHLIICDDMSKDRSFEIISGYAQKYPDKISAHKNAVPTGSAQANFMSMLQYAQSEYVMFSDQDDFWEKDKVKLTLAKMKELEAQNGNIPLLVHTELAIADGELNITHSRFTVFQGLDPKANTLNRLAAQNNVTGCTAMMNRPLLELVKGIDPKNMLMHDWWFAMAAAAFGKIGFVDTPTIRYRQHGNNQLGAVNNRSLVGAAKIVSQRMKTKKRVSITYTQAKNFLDTYRDILPDEARKCLEIYTDIPNHNKLGRIYLLIKHGFLKQNFLTAAGQLVFC